MSFRSNLIFYITLGCLIFNNYLLYSEGIDNYNNGIKITCQTCYITQAFNKLNRHSSEPYISGDTFRSFCDIILDETNTIFYPNKVKDNSLIFVKASMIGEFFEKCHPAISTRYILISHNECMPISNKFTDQPLDNKLLAWFTINTEASALKNSKIFCIPLGLANKYWNINDTYLIEKAKNEVLKNKSKSYLLYLNINLSTYPDERLKVYNMFANKSFCYHQKNKNFYEYLLDIGRSKFVLSPRGRGIDCHRTWEALYMGSIPIVKTSSIDSLYKDLPVLIVKDWSEISEAFLEEKYKEMSGKTYKLEKLSSTYWLNLINQHKSKS